MREQEKLSQTPSSQESKNQTSQYIHPVGLLKHIYFRPAEPVSPTVERGVNQNFKAQKRCACPYPRITCVISTVSKFISLCSYLDRVVE